MTQHCVTTSTPVRKQITVEVPQQRAFDFFTQHMGTWWNPGHQIAERPFVALVVEPRPGGRWFEVDATGAECQWGSVVEWRPPERLVLAWQLTADWRFDPEFVTEVEVRFVALGATTTRVELEHRGLEAYGDAARDVRGQLDAGGGWQGLLERFAQHA